MTLEDILEAVKAYAENKQEKTVIAAHQMSQEKVEELKADVHFLVRYKGEPVFQAVWLEILRTYIKLTQELRHRALVMATQDETREHGNKAVLEIDKIMDSIKVLASLKIGI